MTRPFDLRAMPGVLGELVRRGWPDAALALVAEHGGLMLYVPKTQAARKGLEKLLGMDAAAWLVERYGGGDLLIPTARHAQAAKAEILRMRDAGASIRETAKACKVSVRWVSLLTASARPVDPDERQDALPL